MIERELKLSGLDRAASSRGHETVALLDISETMNVMDHLNRLHIACAR